MSAAIAFGAWSIAEPKPVPLAKTPKREAVVRHRHRGGRDDHQGAAWGIEGSCGVEV
ncbi:MAG TPA: hypothetical protein VH540_27280 [Ktedonobacterales bacterium]|jgi:hypothetical protein